MNINDFRYQLRLKRAVLEAHVAAMSTTIDEIEYPGDGEICVNADDYRRNEEAMFAKYWKIVSEIE
jgi:hypothetical protein